jgi:predicted PurR-regulated permease PerM
MANTVQPGDLRIKAAPPPRNGFPPHSNLPDFARRVVVAVLITVGLLVLTAVLWQGIHILLEAFAGILFGVFLSALAEWLNKHSRFSYGWSLTLVLVGLCGLALGVGWLLASRLADQMTHLLGQMPNSLQDLRAYLEQHEWGRFLLQQLPQVVDTGSLSKFLFAGQGLVSSMTGLLEAILVILVVGIFGAAEPGVYKAGLFHLVPPSQRPRVGEAVDAVTFNLRWWLLGQVFLMVTIGIATGIGLALIGVHFAMALGVIAGILEIIPYLGPWLSAVPACLIALMLSPYHLIFVGCLYLGIHILEGYVLLPLVQRKAVLLPPALTLVAQVLLGELLGLLGLFVAAPLTVVALVLVKMLYVEDTLGDQNVNVPGEPGNDEKPAAQDSGNLSRA